MPGQGRGTRSSNTMSEFLAGMLQDVAYAQSLPDSDLEYLTNLQATILAKLREPMEAAMQQAQQATGAPPMGSATPPPPPPGMGAPMGAPPMGGADMMGAQLGSTRPPDLPPGLRNGGSIPPVDELRRLVGA